MAKTGKPNLTPQNAQAARPLAGGSPIDVRCQVAPDRSQLGGQSAASENKHHCMVRLTLGPVAAGCALNVLVSESLSWLTRFNFPPRHKRVHGGCGLTLRSS